jgi:pimeloyl-ACP methyl ester carboxylesterase
MNGALLVFLIVVGALLALLVAGGLLARRWRLVPTYDEVHRARTDDGWELALHRYRGPLDAARPPVVLCHGVGANRHNLDLDGDRSLARSLRAQGRDVWLVDLRGAGDSDRARPKAGRRPGWTFDDHVRHDVPAALARVRAETGCEEVDWVGFSMGGLLAYAFFGAAAPAATGGDPDAAPDAGAPIVPAAGEPGAPPAPPGPLPRLRRLVTIGSPVMDRPVRSRGVITLAGRLLSPFARTPLQSPARALAFAAAPLTWFAGGQVCARGGSSGAALRVAMTNVIADVSRGVSRQLTDWLARGRFVSADGAVDYAAGLTRIQAPTLVLGGQADRLAPPSTLRAAFERLGAPEKRLVVLGPEHGQRQRYGHGDLAFGLHAPDEVYPLVAGWLAGPGERPGA